MTSKPTSLEAVVTAHLAEWAVPYVDLEIYGHANASGIAVELRELCRRALGCDVATALFYQASIGAVAGLELDDGRRVVVKAHQPDVPLARLAEVAALQRVLAAHDLYAPAPLAGPLPYARGHALIEAFDDRGEPRDGHEPAVRRALARSLHQVVSALGPYVSGSSLPAALIASAPAGALWPTPHSKLFDFEATRRGAEDIDAIATAARARMTSAGRVVLGHMDWRVEHVRFEGDQPVVAYDWDSLCRGTEPALVGFTAKAFCADWTRTDYAQAPTLDEARAFVADYEEARGAAFSSEERSACAATFAHAVAYTSRCIHALGLDEREQPGSFQHLLAKHDLFGL